MTETDNRTELKPPKINKIFIENGSIYVLFVNGIVKKYNVTPLLEKEPFRKLKNLAFLKTATVDVGGYGISWDDDCDLSENELWLNGEPIKESLELDRIRKEIFGIRIVSRD